MPNIAYVNGQFSPLEQATISIEDRGFQFGDGVYEVVRTYGGIPFRLYDHLVRLESSARAVSIPVPLSRTDWEALIREGVQRSHYAACMVYIQLTRGAAPRAHLFPSPAKPTVVMTFREIPETGGALGQQGVSVVTLPDLRWGRCSVKSLNLLANVLAKQEASDAGAKEAILVKDGLVTEGCSSNVCLVRDGTIITPPLSDQLLAGVTRAVVLELARKAGIVVDEREVPQEELTQADELFLIGTTIEVLPVAALNGVPVGGRTPGPVTRTVSEAFHRCILSETGQG
ncbi:MAG: D-amino acid aminotransferase [Nitrospira sp. SB0666_bin_27]|nr:D-amino acid aminotransferase [Nitrospira sp. SB0666_bin_27]MYF25011.1 D-amino acid aminotransferase [Nitrospira sp. SB0678_bin_10]